MDSLIIDILFTKCDFLNFGFRIVRFRIIGALVPNRISSIVNRTFPNITGFRIVQYHHSGKSTQYLHR
jgi:hypothetical protein